MPDPNKIIEWPYYASGSALYIGLDTDGSKSLRFSVPESISRDEMVAFRSALMKHGFRITKDTNVYQKPIHAGQGFPIALRKFAQETRADWQDVRLEDLKKPPFTRRINGEAPDTRKMTPLGLNNERGSVFEAEDGTRYYSSDRIRRLVSESDRAEPELFLRYTDTPKILPLSEALMHRVASGPVTQEKFQSFLNTLLSGYSGDKTEDDVANEILTALPQRIYAVQRDASMGYRSSDVSDRHSAFTKAVNLAINANTILRNPSTAEAYTPSPMVKLLIENTFQGASEIQVRGSGFRAAFRNTDRAGKAERQIIDLTEASETGDPSMVAQSYLADRIANGRTIFAVPGAADSDVASRMRHALGKDYAFEVVANLSPAIAFSNADRDPMTLFFVGSRRPQSLETVPEPAMRTFEVSSGAEIIEAYNEVRRSSRRIREWVSDEERRLEGDMAEVEASEVRQMPYRAISTIGEPFTQVPSAFDGPIMRAQARVVEHLDGREADDHVADLLGMSVDDVRDTLLPEQSDALNFWDCARARRRGMLIGDETGIGKGTTSAAITRAHLNTSGGRVMILTKSAESNGPDVMRDLDRVKIPGTWSVRGMASKKSIQFESANSPVSMLSKAERNSLFQDGTWPADCDVLIAPYSLFAKNPDDFPNFLDEAIGEDMLLVLDESHLALNAKGKVGGMVRAMIDRVDYPNVTFLSATALRKPEGLDLYHRLLPEDSSTKTIKSLDVLRHGGATALESLGTMLAEDGVYLRRTHDLSQLEIENVVMGGDQAARAAAIMDSVSPIFSDFIDIALQTRAVAERRAGLDYQRAIDRGVPPEQAQADSSVLNQYSMNFGGTLAALGRSLDLAIKSDMIADEAIAAYDNGLKPNIYIHSTNEGLLQDIRKKMRGNLEHEDPSLLTFRDQVKRQLNSLVMVRLDGERVDARGISDTVQNAYDRILEKIENIPDLPASPIDRIVSRLEEHGIRTGEITGRKNKLVDGQLLARSKEEQDKRATVNAYQNGELDCVIYNSAADTGITLSQTPEAADRRRRCMVVGELPGEAIGYIQSVGRSNRFGQDEAPAIRVTVTGLTPTIRMAQFMNRMLKRLGATINGNRDHPLVTKDVPDLLNPIGDKAVLRVLQDDPNLALRLGFTDIHTALMARNTNLSDASTDELLAMNGNIDLNSSMVDSLSNKILTRLVMLPSAEDQARVMDRVVAEFQVIEEELNDLGANPLKPKRLPGTVEPVDTVLYSGVEDGESDSAFDRPLYLTTAVHHMPITPFTNEDITERIERAQMEIGVDGLAPYADIVRERMMANLRDLLPSDWTVQDAIERPHLQSTAFRSSLSRSQRLIEMLEQIKPGTIISVENMYQTGRPYSVITGIRRPDPGQENFPSHYKLMAVRPGSDKEETLSLSRLFSYERSAIRFSGNWLDESGSHVRMMMDGFSRGRSSREDTIQVLTGNPLTAITTAKEHRLGEVQEYVVEGDDRHSVNMGIISLDSTLQLENLPMDVERPFMGYEILKRAHDRGVSVRIWDGTDKTRSEADVSVAYYPPSSKTPHPRVVLESFALSRGRHEYFADRPGLYEALTGDALPARDDMPIKKRRHTAVLEWENPEHHRRILQGINAHFTAPNVTWFVDGRHREMVNEIRGVFAGTGMLLREVDIEAVIQDRFPDDTINSDMEHDCSGVELEAQDDVPGRSQQAAPVQTDAGQGASSATQMNEETAEDLPQPARGLATHTPPPEGLAQVDGYDDAFFEVDEDLDLDDPRPINEGP